MKERDWKQLQGQIEDEIDANYEKAIKEKDPASILFPPTFFYPKRNVKRKDA